MTASELDNVIWPLPTGYGEETIDLADLGLREKDAIPASSSCDEPGPYKSGLPMLQETSYLADPTAEWRRNRMM